MKRYLGAIIIVGIVVGAFITADGLSKAIDALSFIFVAGIGVGHALGAKSGESAIARFGDGCVRGGWLGLLVGLTLIAGSEYAAVMDFSRLMPALAVALMTPLYGYFFKLITMQLD